MKQLFVILILLSGLYACTSTKTTGSMNSTKKGKLITAEDSMFYAFGQSIITSVPIQGFEWDRKSFEKGVKEREKEKGKISPEAAVSELQEFGNKVRTMANQDSTDHDFSGFDMKRMSFVYGFYMTNQFYLIELPMARAAFISGFSDAAQGKNIFSDDETSRDLMNRFNQMANAQAREIQNAKNAEAAKENLEAATAFLVENAQRSDVITLEGNIQYKVLESGDGSGVSATVNDKIIIHYEGRLLDGTVFDSSYQRGEKATFPLANLIKGWQEVIPLMKPGDKWTIWIPAEKAYGNTGSPPRIPPGALIVFDIAYFGIAE